jgi:hypothetical protein
VTHTYKKRKKKEKKQPNRLVKKTTQPFGKENNPTVWNLFSFSGYCIVLFGIAEHDGWCVEIGMDH